MLVSFLEGAGAAAASHAELEQRVSLDGREVLRLAFQGHLDLRASSEQRVEEVTDASGLSRGSAEAGHERALATVFGEVTVSRLAYRRRSCPTCTPQTGRGACPPSATPTGFGSWRPPRRRGAPSTAPSRPPPANTSASARWRSWPPGPPSTSRRSTPRRPDPRRARPTWSCCPPTARASSCAPVRCARPRPRPRPTPSPSSPPACPKGEKANRKRMATYVIVMARNTFKPLRSTSRVPDVERREHSRENGHRLSQAEEEQNAEQATVEAQVHKPHQNNRELGDHQDE